MASVFQLAGLPCCTVQPQQGGRAFAPCAGIFANRFADHAGIADPVKHVIADLEHQAQVFGEAQQTRTLVGRASAEHRSSFHREPDQRPGLTRFAVKQIPLGRFSRGVKVHHLPAGQPILTDRAGQREDQCNANIRIRVRGFIGQQLEPEGQQCIPGENGGRFVKFAVQRRAAAAQVIIIHTRQVVMHQRLGVDAFDRCTDAERQGIRSADQFADRRNQQRAEPFATANRSIAHRLSQPPITSFGLPDRAIQRCIDIPTQA